MVNRLCTIAALISLSLFCRADDRIREDCLPFNLDHVKVEFIGGEFKIVDGGHWMFGFGGAEQQAQRALEVIRFYKMDSSCFAGRPHAPMNYLLASGKAPVGSMPEEQCKPFDTSGIVLSQNGVFWKMLSGTEVLFDFGTKEFGAKQAIFAQYRYQFTHRCIVGPAGASFRYMRR